MSTICVFGDSIVWGAADFEAGGWVTRLFIELGRDSKIDVYNLGISGDKTPSILERFESETKVRIEEAEDVILVFAIGINDSYFIHSKNDFMTSPEEFRTNIQKLIEKAQKISTKIIFVGLTPVDELKTTPIPWNTDKSYKNENVKKYNEIIKATCKEKDIHFIEVFDNWISSDYKILLEDGLHPNAAGHQKLFEAVKNFLIKNKVIQL
ncbi:MAG: GDSL-type esterase/lipase family protein [Candidatus Portnoybacteria bacterium]